MRIIGVCQTKGYAQYEIKNIQNPAGIYFHTLNHLRVFNSQWRFLTYINIKDYNEKYNKINNMMEDIKEACKLLIRQIFRSRLSSANLSSI